MPQVMQIELQMIYASIWFFYLCCWKCADGHAWVI